MKTIVTLALIASLAIMPEPVSRAQTPPPDNSGDVQHGCGAGCIIGIAVLLIAGYLIYKMHDFCKKHLPPPNNNPPPPPSRGTNSIAFIGVWSLPTDSKSLPSLDDTAVDLLDISGQNWRDDHGNLYIIAATSTLQSSSDLSTWNDVCSMISYISFGYTNLDWPSNAVTVSYRNGQSVWTNWGDTPYPLAESDRQFYRLRY